VTKHTHHLLADATDAAADAADDDSDDATATDVIVATCTTVDISQSGKSTSQLGR
jgi:hypothetical protein